MSADAERLLLRLPPTDPFVHQVRRAIYESLGSGEVAIKAIARKLDLSVPALRRQLSERGKSYRGLLGSMRRVDGEHRTLARARRQPR